MRKVRFLLAAALVLAAGALNPAPAGEAPEKAKNKRLLLVTHSGGFIHGSVATAEEVLKKVGPENGFDVTCWRFTEDPDKKVKVKVKNGDVIIEVEKPALEVYSERFRGATKLTVEKENCGRINKDTLKNFDVVLFFTTGNPMTKDEIADLREWVKNGGALAGTHCATDTLYGESVYGDLIGAYFRGHPPGLQKIKVKVEDPKHPAAAGFTDGMEYQDEMYIFRDAPYSREKLHIILSIDADSFKPGANLTRKDGDYAISWCRTEGKGRVFYTSFGHDPKVWKDDKFQKHLFGGLKWATGELQGDATPSAKPSGGR
jgi:type 1 glutamine amidotransferase